MSLFIHGELLFNRDTIEVDPIVLEA